MSLCIAHQLVFALVAIVLACTSTESWADIADKAARIIALERKQISRLQTIPQELKSADVFVDEDFAPDKIQTYSSQTLKLLFKSLDIASFYSYGAPRYVSMQQKVFNELVARHLQTIADIERMFHKHLSARMFDKANSLRMKFPNSSLGNIPEIVESRDRGKNLYRVYDISNDSQTATVKHLPIEAGAKIVIAAMAECPVTSRALKYLETDKELLSMLQTNGIIVTIRFEPQGVSYLNSKTSAARSYVAYTKEDWPNIDFSKSPTIYFLKDGNVVHQFVGWGPEKTSARDFKEGLELIGLKKP